MSLAANYDPKLYEKNVYSIWNNARVGKPEAQWLAQGFGQVQPSSATKLGKGGNKKETETYTILMPPPNLTGELHAGHAFQHYLMDTLTRIHRQKGQKSLWYPGVDHAGIQMEGVLGKLLKEQGKSREDLSDEEFLEFAWQKASEWRNRQNEQASVLGDSPDYERLLFTLDERATKMVNYAFKKYWQDGLIYKTSYLINWSVGLQTALSDVAGEIEYDKRVDPFVTFEYRLESTEVVREDNNILSRVAEYFGDNPVLVSTVRPETIFGDVAIAVHPLTFEKMLKKYNFLEAEIQEALRRIQAGDWVFWFSIKPLKVCNVRLIIATEVDPNFGTGALKITPASDMNDYEVFEKYLGGDFPKPVSRDGRLTEVCGSFAGLTVEEARVAVLEVLLENGYIPNVD